jgi:cobalt-zinc-cadmium efflux system outer membrane protein
VSRRAPEVTRLSEKPTVTRLLLLAAAIACVRPTLAADPPPLHEGLDEGEAVRRALSRPAVADELRARVDLARADEIEARRWPNPEASWSHEQVRAGGVTEREDVASVAQRFDPSGRRGLRGDAAARRVEAAGASGAAFRVDVEAEARTAFADLLAAERRVRILRDAAARLESVAAAVTRRASSGDVAGYDRMRVERERLGVLGRLDLEEGALARTRARLGALIGQPSGAALEVRGELLTEPPPPLAELAERLATRPDLRSLELEARAGDLEARAAGRWFLPEVELGGGLKRIDGATGRDAGFAAVLAVPLPLFSREQDERLRGEARARSARARFTLALDAARAEVVGLHAEAARLSAAAARYRETTAADPGALLGTAEAAYRGGEAGVLELIDAYRAALDADLSLVELEWAARRARIDLDRTSGGASR